MKGYHEPAVMMGIEITAGPRLTSSLMACTPGWTSSSTTTLHRTDYLMIKPQNVRGATPELRVVLNWFEELKAKVRTAADPCQAGRRQESAMLACGRVHGRTQLMALKTAHIAVSNGSWCQGWVLRPEIPPEVKAVFQGVFGERAA